MKLLTIGVTAAITIAVTSPVRAQVAAPAAQVASSPAQVAAPAAQQPLPSAGYPAPYRYPYPGLAPRDAYRVGLINRWELEQLEGPTTPALQGPSVDGQRNFQ